MDRRNSLHATLKTITPNVYFDPPENIQLKYPCIIYSHDDVDVKRANNYVYSLTSRYRVTTIDIDPTGGLYRAVLTKFQMCKFLNAFVRENLHHKILELYY